jgi:hypothetical protein
MKHTYKSLFLIGFLILGTLSIQAQPYNKSIGIRAGGASGITYKQFLSSENAFELLANFRWNGFLFTGLYEWQKPISEINGLSYYAGFGAHLAHFQDNASYPNNWNNKWPRESFTVIGVSGILGLEYTFSEIPFSLSIDYLPRFNIIGHTGGWFNDGALSIRYTF